MPRRKRYIYIASEDAEQKALITWWDIACRTYGLEANDLLHVPNERPGGVTVQAHFAAMGVRAGCPDLMLTVPVAAWPGLFIEMKAKTGGLSPKQRPFCERLAARGYAVEVCHGWEKARDAITRYLEPLAPPKL